MKDIIIRDGSIVDGSGNPARRADVAIKHDKIVRIGDLRGEPSDRKIDASKRIVSPGFIDMHAHSDFTLLANPFSYSKIHQGITTEVVGNCGMSMAPYDRRRLEEVKQYLGAFLFGQRYAWNWSTLEEFFQALEARRIGVNIVHLIGHGTVRVSVMGFEPRAPTDAELRAMRNLVAQGMSDGAAGLSSGLIYPPGSFADLSELVELGRVVAQFGGIYTSHIRSESDKLLDSIREAIAVGEEAHMPAHISHLKAVGKSNWGRSLQALNLIDEARRRGLDVTADQYPYPAGSSVLRQALPPWTLEGGTDALVERLRDDSVRAKIRHDIETNTLSVTFDAGTGWENIIHSCGLENIVLSYTEHGPDKHFEGKSLAQMGKETGRDPYDITFDLIADDPNSIMVDFYAHDEDLERIIRHPEVLICTDMWTVAPEGPVTGGTPHPRAYGSFARVLSKYVREKRILSLEEAIHKMTGKTAKRIGLTDRGIIREDAYADLTIFDPETIRDTATFDSPAQYPNGIFHVIVNGKIAVENGKHTGVAAGKILRMSSRRRD
jgi:N-acyl-D-aspartate/D-glutamate deacylase